MTSDVIGIAKKGQILNMLVIIAVMNIFDFMMTWWLIANFGIQMELNPVMGQLFSISPAAAASFKILAIINFLIVIRICARKYYRTAYIGTICVTIIFGIVSIMHCQLIFSLMSI